MIITICIDNC